MLKIILVDDHKVFVQGLQALLSKAEDLEVTHTFTGALELMRHLAEGDLPDVVLLDIEMGRDNGVEVADQVLNLYPSVKVIMLSTYFNEEFVSHLMESGISGYLLKSTDFNDLKESVRKVASGSFAFSPEVMEVIIKGYKTPDEDRKQKLEESPDPLTKRELELVRLIADELTMKEIAEKLYLSEHTVRTHRKNIMAKMDVKNTAGLIKKAFILGLIQ
jgi:DNA-binding NarL/FixJ family response regulator